MVANILDLLLKQIFGQPFILMAIIVFVGYIAMKQKVSKALEGMEIVKVIHVKNKLVNLILKPSK